MRIDFHACARTDDDRRFPLLDDRWTAKYGPWCELIAIVDRTVDIA
jgi:hypothetical protein